MGKEGKVRKERTSERGEEWGGGAGLREGRGVLKGGEGRGVLKGGEKERGRGVLKGGEGGEC